jgi:protein decreased size exclusion limit 1
MLGLPLYDLGGIPSCRRPLFTVKTSTYHFCKMSVVKSPSLTRSPQSGSSCSTSDVEPQRVVIEENAESYDPKEHQQGTERPFSPFDNGKC